MIKKIFIALGALILVPILLYAVAFFIIEPKAQMEPLNSPANYLASDKGDVQKKVLVCVGDSLTHGTVSHNYVDDLAERLADKNIDVVNAGINSNLAYNVLLRIDEIVACKPDYISILIGSNDALGSLGEKHAKHYIKTMGLPQEPTEEFFRENLTELIKQLSEKTNAKIVVLSIPPIGEDLDNVAYLKSVKYSEIIKETAAKFELTYVPLNEKMTDYLVKKGHKPGVSYRGRGRLNLVMYLAIFKRFALGKSFDEISSANGLFLFTDLLHFNSVSSGMVADPIESFVLGAPATD